MSQSNEVQLRKDMVQYQLAARGICDKRVLLAMEKVPREQFVPKQVRNYAYHDGPLPIAEAQTISQPYIVALMIEALALEGGERVLEIGTGSGYSAAVLSEIAGEVYSIERLAGLAKAAATRLANLGYNNVYVIQVDGTQGWPEYAPYDGIVITAGAPHVPETLKSQLKTGGRLVIPVGPDCYHQKLVRLIKLPGQHYEIDELALVRFVPLIGAEAWDEE